VFSGVPGGASCIGLVSVWIMRGRSYMYPLLTLDHSSKKEAIRAWRERMRKGSIYSIATMHHLSRVDRTLTTRQHHKVRGVRR
jgi:hypothetical protein